MTPTVNPGCARVERVQRSCTADGPKVGTVAWKREMARRIDEMKAGNFYTMDEVRALIDQRRR